MNLNLGCSDAHRPGYVNVDICQPADWVADLTKPWPWADETIDAIRAHDIIEHLSDKIHTMNEAFRVLKVGGRLEIVVPTTNGPGAWQDPQHISYWNLSSFQYYVEGDSHRVRFGKANGIKAAFRVVSWEEHDYPGSVFGKVVNVPKLTIILEKP